MLIDVRQQLDAEIKVATSSESVVRMEQSTDHGELPDRMPVRREAQHLVDDGTVEVTEVEDEGNTTRSPEGRSQEDLGAQAKFHDWNNWREANLRQVVALLGANYAEEPLHPLSEELQTIVDKVYATSEIMENLIFMWLKDNAYVSEAVSLVFGEAEKVVLDKVAKSVQLTLAEDAHLRARIAAERLGFQTEQEELRAHHQEDRRTCKVKSTGKLWKWVSLREEINNLHSEIDV